MPNNPIDEAIALETSKVDDAPVEASTEEERIPTAEISDKIPIKYINLRVTDCGKIEKITYTSYDYFGDGSEVEKGETLTILQAAPFIDGAVYVIEADSTFDPDYENGILSEYYMKNMRWLRIVPGEEPVVLYEFPPVP